MTRDWLEWHAQYDDPTSSVSLRLAIVQRDLRRALDEAPRGGDGAVHLVCMCAGEGRDVLPVLAERSDSRVSALLIEFDPVLASRARAAADDAGLSGVEVRVADAGATDTYLDVPPAHVLMVCSVFGNIAVDDMRRTVATLPALLAEGGIVLWTRSGRAGHDPSVEVGACFLDQGFAEMSFTPTADDTFRVGMYRLRDGTAADRRPQPGTRMFSFL